MPLTNANIESKAPLSTPDAVKNELLVPEDSIAVIVDARRSIEKILDRKDSRQLMIVGPCSIHEEASAIQYAEKEDPYDWREKIN